MEVPSPQAGVVEKRFKWRSAIKPETGKLIMIFEGGRRSGSCTGGESGRKPAAAAAAPAAASAKDVAVPDIGADEVEVTEILVKVGDKGKPSSPLITVEGDKASMEVLRRSQAP